MDSKDLKNIASVYEAVYGGGKKEEKKDTRLVVTAADKKANTKAYQNYKAGNKAYKAADHLGEGKAESPEAEEEKDKKDDDLAGAPNGKGKKKAKRWWDDDGDGKGYEDGEVDGKFPDKDGSKKKKGVKEQNELVSKEVKDLQKAAETGKGKYAAKADKLAGVGKGKKKGHDCASKVKHEEYGFGNCIKEMHTLDEDGNVSHYDVMFETKIIKNIPVSDLEIVEGMYHEHTINHDKNSEVLGESESDEYIETVQKLKAAETEADIKRWKALEESGNFTAEEIETIKEADIADILARLEKKRIRQGGNPDESPLGKKTGRAMKDQQDKQRKKAGM